MKKESNNESDDCKLPSSKKYLSFFILLLCLSVSHLLSVWFSV